MSAFDVGGADEIGNEYKLPRQLHKCPLAQVRRNMVTFLGE